MTGIAEKMKSAGYRTSMVGKVGACTAVSFPCFSVSVVVESLFVVLAAATVRSERAAMTLVKTQSDSYAHA